jgi:hypothetical protein
MVCFEGGDRPPATRYPLRYSLYSIWKHLRHSDIILSQTTRAEASGSMREASLYLFLFILGACIVMYHTGDGNLTASC